MNRRIDPVDSHVVPPDQNDTDAHLDTKSPTADSPTETTETVALTLADSTNGSSELPQLFAREAESHGDDLDDFVANVTTIVQSQCERAMDYTDIETLICRLPIDHLTFAAHDSSAPYSGPYPMALLVRAFLIEKINGWDETALHDYLRANPALRPRLGFESLPDQSTFWRGWNHRCSEQLRDAVAECADGIVTAARACDVTREDSLTHRSLAISRAVDPCVMRVIDGPEEAMFDQRSHALLT